MTPAPVPDLTPVQQRGSAILAVLNGLPPDTPWPDVWAKTQEALRLNAFMGPYWTGEKTPSAQQTAFLLAHQRVVLFGGATKGGKTDAVLLDALKYVEIPDYLCLILDRSITNLTRGDGIIPRLKGWTSDPKLGVKWDEDNHTAIFPSGAKVVFGFIERAEDQGKYKRANYQRIYWEELTEHPPGELLTEPPEYFTYLFSRLARSAISEIPLAVRATSNPDGPGRLWVKTYFGLGHDDDGHRLPRPSARRHYIPTTFRDNPGIDQALVAEALDELGDTRKAQLKDGDWDVTERGNFFDVDQIRLLMPEQVRAWRQGVGISLRYRGWDKAGTDASDPNASRAKFTVGLRVARVDRRIYGVDFLIEDCIREQWGIDRRNRAIRETAGIYDADLPPSAWLVAQPDPWQQPGQVDTWIIVEQEPADSGKESAMITIRQLGGRIVEVFKPSTDKETRARTCDSQHNAGNYAMVPAAWNAVVKAELKAFSRKAKYKDIVDTLGMVHNKLELAVAPALPASSPGKARALVPVREALALPDPRRRLLPPGVGLPARVPGGPRW